VFVGSPSAIHPGIPRQDPCHLPKRAFFIPPEMSANASAVIWIVSLEIHDPWRDFTGLAIRGA